MVIVDEAQRLNPTALDCLRLISSMPCPGPHSIHLLLSAQPEIAQSTAGASALGQRISTRFELGGKESGEVWKYLAVRLARAGADDRVLFLPEAIAALAAYSAGTPRAINLLADHCLMAAYGSALDCVDEETVSNVATHLELASKQRVPYQGMHYECPGEFSNETWRSAIAQYRQQEIPEPLRMMAAMLMPSQVPLPAA